MVFNKKLNISMGFYDFYGDSINNIIQYQPSSIWRSPNWGGWLNPNGFFALPNFIKQHGFLRLFKMTKTFQKFSLSGLFKHVLDYFNLSHNPLQS